MLNIYTIYENVDESYYENIEYDHDKKFRITFLFDVIQGTYYDLFKSPGTYEQNYNSIINSLETKLDECQQLSNNIFDNDLELKIIYYKTEIKRYKQVNKFYELFSKIPPIEKPFVVYRGLGDTLGLNFNDKRPLFTALNKKTALEYSEGSSYDNYFLKITVPPGTRVIPQHFMYNWNYEHEKMFGEILLEPNLQLTCNACSKNVYPFKKRKNSNGSNICLECTITHINTKKLCPLNNKSDAANRFKKKKNLKQKSLKNIK